jgi:uncharacterized OsmC-like protein
MNARELHDVQAPLKQKYKANPEKAMLTLTSEGKMAADMCCTLTTAQSKITAGLHPAAGGKEGTTSPVSLLLSSLVTCFGVTMGAISTHMGFPIRNGTIRAEGDLDLRGTLGIEDTAPVGLLKARLCIELDTDESEENTNILIEAAKKYAVVYQTLVKSIEIDISFAKMQQAKAR